MLPARRWRRQTCGSTRLFQWAPTLGGECYLWGGGGQGLHSPAGFQRAPTLGGECYDFEVMGFTRAQVDRCFNGHPPLGVNATAAETVIRVLGYEPSEFQWAPTLGGECYARKQRGCWGRSPTGGRFNGHPPLGVNATYGGTIGYPARLLRQVSMGTHPWG